MRGDVCSVVSLYSSSVTVPSLRFFFFFFNDTATTEIYTLSLHDALPIYPAAGRIRPQRPDPENLASHIFGDGALLVFDLRSEEHTSELQSLTNLVCRLLLEKKKKNI